MQDFFLKKVEAELLVSFTAIVFFFSSPNMLCSSSVVRSCEIAYGIMRPDNNCGGVYQKILEIRT